MTVSFAGQTWWVAIEDIGLLRDGVGIAVPVGVPASFTDSVADPLGELLGRYARTHGPFTTADAADTLRARAAGDRGRAWPHGGRPKAGARRVHRRRTPNSGATQTF